MIPNRSTDEELRDRRSEFDYRKFAEWGNWWLIVLRLYAFLAAGLFLALLGAVGPAVMFFGFAALLLFFAYRRFPRSLIAGRRSLR